MLGDNRSTRYNSNTAHYKTTEEEGFRTSGAEAMLFEAGLDAMFAGHVHAYERTFGVYDNALAPCGPVYVTIGDGGNREGLASGWHEPQPAWSAFREASYGHGTLELASASEATWRWHRNQDGEAVVADEFTLIKCSAEAKRGAK